MLVDRFGIPWIASKLPKRHVSAMFPREDSATLVTAIVSPTVLKTPIGIANFSSIGRMRISSCRHILAAEIFLMISRKREGKIRA